MHLIERNPFINKVLFILCMYFLTSCIQKSDPPKGEALVSRNEKYVDSINAKETTQISEPSYEGKKDEFEIKGNWEATCNSSCYVYLTMSGAQMNCMDNFSINADLVTKEGESNSYLLKYSGRTQIVPADHIDWDNISRDSSIAYIKQIATNRLEFQWYGFYNLHTEKREVLNSGFGRDSSGKPVILTKCIYH